MVDETHRRKKIIAFKVSPTYASWLQEKAKEKDLSVSQMIRLALRDYTPSAIWQTTGMGR